MDVIGQTLEARSGMDRGANLGAQMLDDDTTLDDLNAAKGCAYITIGIIGGLFLLTLAAFALCVWMLWPI